MKKALSIILVLCLTAFSAFALAEQTDYSSISTEDLVKELNTVRNELYSRDIKANGEIILLDQDGIMVYLTGAYEIHNYSDSCTIEFEAVLINNTDKHIIVDPSASINGWDVGRYHSIDASAGHKSKGTLEYSLSDANISTYEEITDIDFRIDVSDNSFNRLFDSLIPITILFNQPQS